MIFCSQCGTAKRETNHWYFSWIERGGLRLCIVAWSFDPELVHEASVQKLCGQQCVQKAVQQYLDECQAREAA